MSSKSRAISKFCHSPRASKDLSFERSRRLSDAMIAFIRTNHSVENRTSLLNSINVSLVVLHTHSCTESSLALVEQFPPEEQLSVSVREQSLHLQVSQRVRPAAYQREPFTAPSFMFKRLMSFPLATTKQSTLKDEILDDGLHVLWSRPHFFRITKDLRKQSW